MLLHVLKSQMSLILSILNAVIVAIKDKLYSHTFLKIVIHSPYRAKRESEKNQHYKHIRIVLNCVEGLYSTVGAELSNGHCHGSQQWDPKALRQDN